MQEQLIYQIGNNDAVVPARLGNNPASFFNVNLGSPAGNVGLITAPAGKYIYLTGYLISGSVSSSGGILAIEETNGASTNVVIGYQLAAGYQSLASPAGFYYCSRQTGSSIILFATQSPNWNAYVTMFYGFSAVQG